MRTISRVVGAALVSGIVATTLASSARAEPIGKQGDISFSADRLMGLYLFDQADSATVLGIGAAPLFAHPYTVPRLSVDGFVIDHLSVGGSLGIWVTDPNHGGSASGVLLAPRVGYAISFSNAFGFWPRGGFTFWSFGGNDEFGLTMEAMFYGSPVEHFAFTFGPVIDIGIAGNGDHDRAHSIGIISGGIMGWI